MLSGRRGLGAKPSLLPIGAPCGSPRPKGQLEGPIHAILDLRRRLFQLCRLFHCFSASRLRASVAQHTRRSIRRIDTTVIVVMKASATEAEIQTVVGMVEQLDY